MNSVNSIQLQSRISSRLLINMYVYFNYITYKK